MVWNHANLVLFPELKKDFKRLGSYLKAILRGIFTVFSRKDMNFERRGYVESGF